MNTEMDEVLEYLFFTRIMADRFVQALNARGLPYTEDVEPVQEAILIKIPEGLDEALWDELDDLYDTFSTEDQVLMESGVADAQAKSTAGIYLQLAGGKQTIAQVDPDIMNRMLAQVSMEEFNAFVEAIVRSVENPDDSPICKC